MSIGRFLLSAKKKAVATLVVLLVIAVAGYFLISSASTGGGRGGANGDNSGLGSINARTVVTLTVMGGSAFITGFGFRDVIGRAVAARQRARMKSVQQPVRH